MSAQTLTARASLRPFLKPFTGEVASPPPIWLMRQAGRYLSEYREIRSRVGGFLDLCYSPELACEVTLQPIRRFGFDAAILFSDILVVPDALGQAVRFAEGEGPLLDRIADEGDLRKLDPSRTGEKFAIVWETVQRLRQDLPRETALIGFCGAPWTVATYMVGGRGSVDQAVARCWAYSNRNLFRQLIDIIIESSVEYLSGQIKAGADALQIFDSWAGNLPDDEFERWVVEPTQAIVAKLRTLHPEVPILGFPRGADVASADFVARTKVDGISCNTSMPLSHMAKLATETGAVVQGNLDPLLLVAGGAALDTRVAEIMAAMKGKRFIFNLGHGIVPQTPPEHVARLVELVRRT